MPPFFAEMARVLRPGGFAIVASSWGAATPFYTPNAVLERGFGAPRRRARSRAARRARDLLGRSPAALSRTVRAVPGAPRADRQPLVRRRAAASKLLPEVERPRWTSTRLGLPDRAHPQPRARRRGGARRAAERGEVPGGDERRRPDRPDRRRAGRHGRADGDHPRRARQRPRAGARDPDRGPGEAVEVLAAGDEREIDVGEVNGGRFLCIASCGFDSDANRIANEARLDPRQPRLRVRGAASPRRLAAGALHDRARRRAPHASAATRWRSPTAAPSAAACSSPPTPSSTTGSSTWS